MLPKTHRLLILYLDNLCLHTSDHFGETWVLQEASQELCLGAKIQDCSFSGRHCFFKKGIN